MVWHRGARYLLCSLEGFSDITTLAVHRIQSLEEIGEELAPPKVDVDDVRQAFGIFVSDDVQYRVRRGAGGAVRLAVGARAVQASSGPLRVPRDPEIAEERTA